jgi:hypothetical protein
METGQEHPGSPVYPMIPPMAGVSISVIMADVVELIAQELSSQAMLHTLG